MKNPFKLLLFLIMLSYSSCSNEEIIQVNDVNNNAVHSKKTTERKTSNDSRNIEDVRFENLMQWTAYLTTQVLFNSNEGRSQLIHSYSNSTSGAVKLEDLLDDSLLNESFKAAFQIEFNDFVLGALVCEADNNDLKSKDRPTPPGKPTGTNGEHESWFFENLHPSLTDDEVREARFEQFLSLILEDNCLEIYLPNGYSASARSMKSTAHPLIDQNFNDLAFRHIEKCDVEYTTVVNRATGNIVAVRPDKNIFDGDPNCYYSQYPFDFINFLE